MVKAVAEESADDEVLLGPCLLWGDPPPKGTKREWVPPKRTRAELMAKPGERARVFTWASKTAATSAADAIRKDRVPELPPSQWVALSRAMGERSALWLTYDRRRQAVDVETDRRKEAHG